MIIEVILASVVAIVIIVVMILYFGTDVFLVRKSPPPTSPSAEIFYYNTTLPGSTSINIPFESQNGGDMIFTTNTQLTASGTPTPKQQYIDSNGVSVLVFPFDTSPFNITVSNPVVSGNLIILPQSTSDQ